MPKVVPEYKKLARKRIVQGAYKVFRERGYHQTKMIDIADELEYSKATLYSYFTSKEELFSATFEYRIEMRQKEIFSLLEDLTFLATEEFFEKIYSSLTNAPLFSSDVINEARKNDLFREKLTVRNEQAIKRFLIFFDEQKKNKNLRANIDSTSLALAFLALRDGFLRSQYYGFGTDKVKKAWTWIASLFLKDILV